MLKTPIAIYALDDRLSRFRPYRSARGGLWELHHVMSYIHPDGSVTRSNETYWARFAVPSCWPCTLRTEAYPSRKPLTDYLLLAFCALAFFLGLLLLATTFTLLAIHFLT